MSKGETFSRDTAHRVNAPWGSLTWLVNAELVSGAEQTIGVVTIQPGHSNDAHRHPNCEEVIYVMSGQCDQRVGDSIRPLTAGEGVVIPRGVPHSSINTGDEVLNVLVSYSSPSRVVEPVGVPADVHT